MTKRRPLLVFFVLLFVLHQDFWWRDEPALVFGVLPVSLAYHIGWTLLVALGWWLVAKHAWPVADESPGTPSRPANQEPPR